MQKVKKLMVFGAAIFLAVVFSLAANQNPVAETSIGSSTIHWLPRVEYSQMVLTISAPNGEVYNRTFTGSSAPYFDLSSAFGGRSLDGVYTYELRVIRSTGKKTRPENDSKAGMQKDKQVYPDPAVQAGHFRVMGGSIVSNIGDETPARPMDVVHADDVIITGSQCVGFDCLTDNSENFGFDTIKLKENNLRIYFDDTSSTAGFPANDWRIITNDSSSGGGNYISIEDSTNSKTPFKIEAGARTSAIYVSSTGRVGLGTSTPVLNLHILQGDTPSVRLDQDTSSGWTAQVWDIAGNESNFFIRDTTGGSKLPFRIQPGTPTNTITMKADGKVGIGTWSPAYTLDMQATGANCVLAVTRTSGASIYVNATDAYANFGSINDFPTRIAVNSVWRARFNNDNSLTMASNATCTAGGTWTNASSITLKENIQALSTQEAVETLNNLNPVKYNYKVDKEERHVGFIAEDVPDLVASKDRKGMSPMDVTAVLTQVVKEQQKMIQEQQKTITELNQRLSALEKK